jgi:diguanylate cyclase (GGDEF)-like protein
MAFWIFLTLSLLLLGTSVALSRLTVRLRLLKKEIKEQTLRNQSKDRVLQEHKQATARAQADLSSLAGLSHQLPDLAQRFSTCHTVQDVEDQMVHLTLQLLDAKSAAFLTAGGNELLLSRSRGLTPKQEEALQKVRIGEGKIGWAAQKRLMMFAQDFERESNLIREDIEKSPDPIQTDLCVPLVHQDRLYGLIHVGGIGRSEHAKLLMSLVAQLSVVSLENLMLLEESRRASDLDNLTGLYNMTYLHKYLDRELNKAQRYSRPLTVVIFDLDGFGPYNARYGRIEGDKVLRVVSSLIKESLRNVDLACRYGGEELAMILPETEKEKGLLVAERTRLKIQNYPFSPQRITVSGGIGCYPADAQGINSLLQAAETALKKAKDLGRNRVEVVSGST